MDRKINLLESLEKRIQTILSYNNIKLLTFNRCNRTAQRQSGTDPKSTYHFNPLLPMIVYVAWLVDSCIPLRDLIQNIESWKLRIPKYVMFDGFLAELN